MAHQVDQDIDAVAVDRARRGSVVHVGERGERVGEFAKTRRERVVARRRRERIQVQGHARAVVRGEHLEQQPSHHVGAKIRGKIADPEPPVGRGNGARRRRRGRRAKILLLQSVVDTVQPRDGFAGNIVILQARQDHREQFDLVGTIRPVEREREVLALVRGIGDGAREGEPGHHQLRRQRRIGFEALEILDRVVQPPQREEVAAQREPGMRVARRERARALEVALRRVGVAAALQGQSEIAQRLDRLAVDRDRALEGALRVGEAAGLEQQVPHRQRRRDPARAMLHRHGEAALGVRRVAAGVEKRADVVMHLAERG